MKIVEEIQNYLKNENDPDEFIERNFNDILATIFLLEKNLKAENVDKVLNDIRIVLHSIMLNILDSELTDEYLLFVTSYCDLAYNLSINTKNVKDINLLCRYISKNIELIQISRTSIDIIRDASIKFKEWTQFNPPSFTISKNLLEEVIKE